MIRNIVYRFLAVAALVAAVACAEDPDTDTPTGQGESRVSFGVNFRPLADAALGRSRSVAGDAIRNIDDLFVVWYHTDGRLAGSDYVAGDRLTVTDQERPGSQTETTTKHAEFSSRMPYGRYRVYAVANMGDLTGDGRIATEKDFRALSLTWNPDDVAANDQMSGRFTREGIASSADGTVTIDASEVTLQSWIRRAASKVTVAFDASRLNENIYIYLQSAQIRDIPLTCSLVDDNAPASADALIEEGDMIRYGEGDDFLAWPTLACGRGANTYGSHAGDAPSLFFFENMQGTHEKKHQYQNFKSKDNVPYGTYVEVKAYYLNKSSDNPSRGSITYRCMLGKDMVEDFNAERNTHYKLTLVFNKDANDPDWHIEYEYTPRPPEIMVPSPIYISYIANQGVSIPVTIYYDKDKAAVESVTATITDNDWGFAGHKYDYTNQENYNGFLSLELLEKNSADRKTEYKSEGIYSDWKYVTDDRYRIDIPVYTRPMTLGSSFSGNNYFVGRRRYATVRLVANLVGGGSVSQDVEIIQSRRLVNPKGVWRSGGSTTPFRVTLKNSDSSPTVATTFEPLISDGPWTATILHGADWVRIKDTESSEWGTADVTGGTGSKIEFDYRPASEYPSGSRFGKIEIRFHNNTCTHVLLVSQGMGPVELDGRKWHMTNFEWGDKDAANPLLEGSMVKFGNAAEAILSTNNIKPDYGFDISCADKLFDIRTPDGAIVQKAFNKISANLDGFVDEQVTSGGKCRVANSDDWATLTSDRFVRYYGILYGDECSDTLSENSETNTYYAEGQQRGMRGCFVCERETGRHLFFPIGATGYGRRKYRDNTNVITHPVGYGVLKYANRTEEMPKETAEAVPNFYSLWDEPGAVYWYGTGEPYAFPGETSPRYYMGFDLNYFSFGFENYSSWVFDRTTSDSDAAFIRRIDN